MYIIIYQNALKLRKRTPFHPVNISFKSVLCVEVTLITLYQKTKWTHNGWIPEKADSNRRRTLYVSPFGPLQVLCMFNLF